MNTSPGIYAGTHNAVFPSTHRFRGCERSLLPGSRCCRLLPIKTGTYVTLLKEQIPALFLEKTTILGKTTHKAITDAMQSTHGACRGERIDFLNPETLLVNIQELFIDPEEKEKVPGIES